MVGPAKLFVDPAWSIVMCGGFRSLAEEAFAMARIGDGPDSSAGDEEVRCELVAGRSMRVTLADQRPELDLYRSVWGGPKPKN
jgi:hypothetical protein